MPAYELVLQFRGPRVETEDEVVEIEDVLHELLGEGEAVDGHEVGAHARNISVTTQDAEATFRRLAPFLEGASLIGSVVAAARRLTDDTYVLVWPKDRTVSFSRT